MPASLSFALAADAAEADAAPLPCRRHYALSLLPLRCHTYDADYYRRFSLSIIFFAITLRAADVAEIAHAD